MKPGVRLIVVTSILLSFITSQSNAGDLKLSYDGQIRLRSELDFKSFSPIRKAQSFHDLRTRLGLKFEPSEEVAAYIQFQDSRRLGVKGSGDLQSLNNVDLHQVYFVIRNLLFKNIYFRGGRFELNFGNQRVFGSVSWHNIGRSWDGLMMSYHNEGIMIDFFNLKRRELNIGGDPQYNAADFFIIGTRCLVESIGLDISAFYENDRYELGSNQDKLKRLNVGGYYSGRHHNMDFAIQGNYQFGEAVSWKAPLTLVLDLSAFMAATEIGYTFKADNPLRLAAGIDYTSGDDGSDTTKFKAYQNAYYTGHAFRGYMDYFIGSPAHGLVDLMFRGSFNYHKAWIFKGDFHYFRAAEDYLSNSDGTTLTKKIGMEIDLTVVNKSIEGATLTGGVSAFFADKHYSSYGDNSDPGFWAYFMTTINFDNKE